MKRAIYLFCLARSGRFAPLQGRDVTGKTPLLSRDFAGITAVVSRAAIEDFCGPRAQARMRRLKWVAPRACRHAAIIQRVMRVSPVVPARFGTLFSSLKSLEAFVRRHRDALSQFLNRVADQQEWSVKGRLDRRRARAELVPACAGPVRSMTSRAHLGSRYLQEKRDRAAVERGLNSQIEQICNSMARNLAAAASDYRERPVLSSTGSGRDTEIILNWAFLVPRSSTAIFRAQVQKANSELGHFGLTFDLTGPWPPYSFSPALDP